MKLVLQATRHKFTFVCFTILFSSGAYAQERLQEPLATELLPDSDDKVIVMPASRDAIEGHWVVDDVQLSVERSEHHVTFKAIRGKHKRQQAVSATMDRRFAYDPRSNRFKEVLQSVRLKLHDYDQLQDIIESTEAIDGETYRSIDEAIVRVPKEIDPTVFAREISSHPNVRSANVMLAMPRMVPQ